MITCEAFIPCERVVQDQHTHNVTLVSCLEQVSALQFPSMHYGFAVAARLAWQGPLPTSDLDLKYRVLRFSDTDEEQVITEGSMAWEASTRRGRVLCSFPALRLRRPEVIRFRIEFCQPDGDWQTVGACSIDVGLLEMTDEERQDLLARWRQQQQAEVRRLARENRRLLTTPE